MRAGDGKLKINFQWPYFTYFQWLPHIVKNSSYKIQPQRHDQGYTLQPKGQPIFFQTLLHNYKPSEVAIASKLLTNPNNSIIHPYCFSHPSLHNADSINIIDTHQYHLSCFSTILNIKLFPTYFPFQNRQNFYRTTVGCLYELSKCDLTGLAWHTQWKHAHLSIHVNCVFLRSWDMM